MRGAERSVHAGSGTCYRKRAVSGPHENNDLPEIVVQSCQVQFAVVIKVSDLQAIEFAGNCNQARWGFRERSIAVPKRDFNAIQVRESQIENTINVEIPDYYGSRKVVQGERYLGECKCPITFSQKNGRAATEFKVIRSYKIRDAVSVEVPGSDQSKIPA